MIALFTDFGWQGPYVGLLKAVLHRAIAGVTIIDLLHDAPRFNPKASAYLHNALRQQFEIGTIFIGVVDPRVGDNTRRPVIVSADDRWYIGPDNGLFEIITSTANNVDYWEITWRPEKLSSSFHGRDLFAPVAAKIAQGIAIDLFAKPLAALSAQDYLKELAEIIYIDHYGNCMTGLPGESINLDSKLIIAQQVFTYACTFAEAPLGQGFWYINSTGLVELAINSGNFQQQLGCIIGQAITVSSA